MVLNFQNGDPFATGSIGYLYEPATEWEITSRILLPIEIAEFQVEAIVDTGAPYVVCTPEIALHLGMEPSTDSESMTIHWHGKLTGHLHRHTIMLRAETGEDLIIDATIFVPDADSTEAWEYRRRPFVIGMGGCLERMRFGVDPANDMFYFGPSP
jgi:hypothetical protein